MLQLTDGAKSLVAGSAGGAIAAAVVGALWHIIPTVMPLFGSMISGFGGSSFNPAAPGPIGGTTPAAGTFTTLASTVIGGSAVLNFTGNASSADTIGFYDGAAPANIRGSIIYNNSTSGSPDLLTFGVGGINATRMSITGAGVVSINNLSTAGYVKNDATGLLSSGTIEHDFNAYNAANVAAAVALSETTVTNASTVTTGSKITTDVAGVGGGNFVMMLCTDGTTCAAGNQRLTCTQACTAVAGTRTACTVQNGGTIAAATVVTWSVTTACATTDPGMNVNAHLTTP